MTKAPVSGNTVYLTLDSRIQKVAMTSLAKNVQELQKNAKAQAAAGKSNVGEDCLGGGAVLIRLSAVSYTHLDVYKRQLFIRCVVQLNAKVMIQLRYNLFFNFADWLFVVHKNLPCQ